VVLRFLCFDACISNWKTLEKIFGIGRYTCQKKEMANIGVPASWEIEVERVEKNDEWGHEPFL
jgi:hypothetical protein